MNGSKADVVLMRTQNHYTTCNMNGYDGNSNKNSDIKIRKNNNDNNTSTTTTTEAKKSEKGRLPSQGWGVCQVRRNLAVLLRARLLVCRDDFTTRIGEIWASVCAPALWMQRVGVQLPHHTSWVSDPPLFLTLSVEQFVRPPSLSRQKFRILAAGAA